MAAGALYINRSEQPAELLRVTADIGSKRRHLLLERRLPWGGALAEGQGGQSVGRKGEASGERRIIDAALAAIVTQHRRHDAGVVH